MDGVPWQPSEIHIYRFSTEEDASRAQRLAIANVLTIELPLPWDIVHSEIADFFTQDRFAALRDKMAVMLPFKRKKPERKVCSLQHSSERPRRVMELED
jgi:hypothetical protein